MVLLSCVKMSCSSKIVRSMLRTASARERRNDSVDPSGSDSSSACPGRPPPLPPPLPLPDRTSAPSNPLLSSEAGAAAPDSRPADVYSRCWRSEADLRVLLFATTDQQTR
jgi:hypothetical protein